MKTLRIIICSLLLANGAFAQFETYVFYEFDSIVYMQNMADTIVIIEGIEKYNLFADSFFVYGEILGPNAINWNAAFGWGNHATEGYLTTEADGSTTNEIELPVQTGNAGRFLSTNGAVPGWAVISLSNSATLDFPNTNAGESSDLTITVTGAALGDPVNVGVHGTAVVNHSCYTAWVSSINTVTVRFNNYNSVSLADPLSATFKVTVEK